MRLYPKKYLSFSQRGDVFSPLPCRIGLRITNIWNKLPHHVVNASSLNSFKSSVDRYFISSNMYYDYKFKPEAEQQLWKQDSSDHTGHEG